MTTPQNHRIQWVFWVWVILFLAMLLYGFSGIFGKTFWHSWEVASLVSTTVYCIIFYVVGFFGKRKMFKELTDISYVGLLGPLMLGAIACLVVATLSSFLNWDYRIQVAAVTVVGFCFCGISRIMSERSNNAAVREDFKVSLNFNDFPVTIAFFILLLYAIAFKAVDLTGDEALFRAFVGGAIAFQMIASNWIFAVAFRRPGFMENSTVQ